MIVSCEKPMFLRSEKKMKKAVAGTWMINSMPRTKTEEQWTFDNGVVQRYAPDSTGTFSEIDRGYYALDGRLSSAFIEITDFKLSVFEYNARYQIIQLDDEIFIITTNETKGGGLLTLEFYRK